MSRIGKMSINVPSNVEIIIGNNEVLSKGPLGELSLSYSSLLDVNHKENQVTVTPQEGATSKTAAIWGLTRSLLSNNIKGVSEGFTQSLELVGVGFRSSLSADILTLFLGYSHEIKYLIPSDIKIKVVKPTLIEISGIDKQRVGQVSSVIMGLKKIEPYKGKGIRKLGQRVVLKEGKKK